MGRRAARRPHGAVLGAREKKKGPCRMTPPPATLAALSPAQRRVVLALLDADDHDGPPTYRAVAARLGVHLGTVHRQLGRVRARHPAAYALVMQARAAQLAQRHRRALARAAARSRD